MEDKEFWRNKEGLFFFSFPQTTLLTLKAHPGTAEEYRQSFILWWNPWCSHSIGIKIHEDHLTINSRSCALGSFWWTQKSHQEHFFSKLVKKNLKFFSRTVNYGYFDSDVHHMDFWLQAYVPLQVGENGPAEVMLFTSLSKLSETMLIDYSRKTCPEYCSIF